MVPRTKRHERTIDVRIIMPEKDTVFLPVQNAVDIYGTLLKICIHMPKRKNDLVAKPLLEISTEMVDCVKRGNSIIPKYKSDAIIRRNFVLKSKAACDSLSTQLNVFVENPELQDNVSNGDLIRLAGLVTEELKQLQDMLNNDEVRYLCQVAKCNGYHIVKNTIKYFNELFIEYGKYEARKPKHGYQNKRYRLIAFAVKQLSYGFSD